MSNAMVIAVRKFLLRMSQQIISRVLEAGFPVYLKPQTCSLKRGSDLKQSSF